MEQLFKDNKKITLKEVEKVINKLIDSNSIQMDSKLLEKWNLLPVVFLENEDTSAKIIEIVKFIDGLDIEIQKKVSYILTSIYLIEELKLNIFDKDINSIYLLISYMDEVNIKDTKNTFNRINNNDLLYAVRLKSLDLNIRTNILRYIDINKLSYEEAIEFLKNTDYNDLLAKLN